MRHRCENCLRDGDILVSHRSTKNAKQRHLSDRRRCEQLWDEKCIQGYKVPASRFAQHYAIRDYLNIESNAVIDLVKLNQSRRTRARISNNNSKQSPTIQPIGTPSSEIIKKTQLSSSSSSSSSQTNINNNPTNSTNDPSTILKNISVPQDNLIDSLILSKYKTRHIKHNNCLKRKHQLLYKNESQLLCQPCYEPPQNEITVEDLIVDNIKQFMKSNSKGGPISNKINITKECVLTACTSSSSDRHTEIRDTLGINRSYFASFKKRAKKENEPITALNVTFPQHHKYSRKTTDLMLQCINEFCHSEEGTSVDSNSFKIHKVDGDEHPQRIWRVSTCNEQYELFKQSDVVERYLHLNSSNFRIPSRSFFLQHRCTCVDKPTMMSCVDRTMSSLYHYMRSLSQFIL
jgi:hypothetical protein